LAEYCAVEFLSELLTEFHTGAFFRLLSFGGDFIDEVHLIERHPSTVYVSRIAAMNLKLSLGIPRPKDAEVATSLAKCRGEKLTVADLEMDMLSRRVMRGGQEIGLQPREFKLLEYLMRHAGQIVTRTMLLENVWDYHFDPQTNVIDVHISRLRAKIDKGFDAPLLQTVRGAGYSLRAPD